MFQPRQIRVPWQGTFKMYPICTHWAYWGYLLSVTTMCSACAQWVLDPLSPVYVHDLRTSTFLCQRPVTIHPSSSATRWFPRPPFTSGPLVLGAMRHGSPPRPPVRAPRALTCFSLHYDARVPPPPPLGSGFDRRFLSPPGSCTALSCMACVAPIQR